MHANSPASMQGRKTFNHVLLFVAFDNLAAAFGADAGDVGGQIVATHLKE